MSGIRAPMTDAPALGCGAAGPKSGCPLRLRHLRREPLELAAPDVLEVAPRRASMPPPRRGRRARRTARPPAATVRAPAPRSRPSSRPRSARTARRRPRPCAGARPGAAAGRSTFERAREQRPGRPLQRRPASPASVMHRSVVRRVRRPVEQVRTAAPRRRPPSTIARTTSGRRPSLMLGTHSMIRHAHRCSTPLNC